MVVSVNLSLFPFNGAIYNFYEAVHFPPYSRLSKKDPQNLQGLHHCLLPGHRLEVKHQDKDPQNHVEEEEQTLQRILSPSRSHELEWAQTWNESLQEWWSI